MDLQSEKYGHLITATATASLIALLFILSLQQLWRGGKIQQLEWDMSTITAGDYTVTFDIKAKSYKNAIFFADKIVNLIRSNEPIH